MISQLKLKILLIVISEKTSKNSSHLIVIVFLILLITLCILESLFLSISYSFFLPPIYSEGDAPN